MCKLSFVILHYLALEDTIECIESIKKNVGIEEFKIIVVDNCSPDDSFCKLKNLYYEDRFVVLLHNDENVGFSRGNNVGFRYAKNILKSEFIVLSNNDICLFQNDFALSVFESYDKHHFDVMGPMIITRDGSCLSSPEKGHIFSPEEINDLIQTRKRALKKYKMYLDLTIIKKFLLFKKTNINKKIIDQINFQENVLIHGSFMVFSKNYINKFDGLDEKTFMYFEEDILYLHIYKNNMKSIYDPNIVVYHKEDCSVEYKTKNERRKNIFFLENSIKSYKAYLEILNDYGDQ